jgi:hypothetical protein
MEMTECKSAPQGGWVVRNVRASARSTVTSPVGSMGPSEFHLDTGSERKFLKLRMLMAFGVHVAVHR